MSGVPPKRSDQRRRANTPAAGEPVKAPAGPVVEGIVADPSWHPIMRRWFESLAESGQSAFYEASDWATAAVVAVSLVKISWNRLRTGWSSWNGFSCRSSLSSK